MNKLLHVFCNNEFFDFVIYPLLSILDNKFLLFIF